MIDFSVYIKNGFLKKQKANFKQIEKQLVRAEKDLLAGAILLEKDPEWAATIAYQAMLRAGRALLFSYGFLPADGRQHKTVVEVTGKILGEQFDLVVSQFEKLRKKRNIFFYESVDSGNKGEAMLAAEIAKTLISTIKKKVSEHDPQTEIIVS
jgi:uncharacterized protein (UPF0332 family)